MKKTVVLFLALLLLLSGCAGSGTGNGPVLKVEESVAAAPETPLDIGDRVELDFEHSCWGDSMEQVMAQEGQEQWRLVLQNQDFAGLVADLHFIFYKGALASGGYLVKTDEARKYGDFIIAQEYLTERLGTPADTLCKTEDGVELAGPEKGMNEGIVVWSTEDRAVSTELHLWENELTIQVLLLSGFRDSDPEPQTDRSGEPDFEHSFWGDSVEQVLANEGESNWKLLTTSEFAGFSMPTYFVFQGGNNVLYFGYYDLTVSDMESRNKYEKYAFARAYLTSLYGESAYEFFRAPDDTKLPEMGSAEQAGGTANAIWYAMTPEGERNSLIVLQLESAGIRAGMFCGHPSQLK